MDRTTAVTTWREVCGNDAAMAMPPTGRMLEEFARRIADAERKACANQLTMTRSDAQLMAGEMTAQEWRTLSAVLVALQIRMRSNEKLRRDP